MFDYLKGILTSSAPDHATVEIGGLGYKLLIPLSTYTKLPQIGNPITLFVSSVIREDSHRLFGFIDKSHRHLFEKCNDITGVGPKTSLALIGHLEISDLEIAIATSNVDALCKVPGVGKKTAERIILEMKGLISDSWKTSKPSPIFSQKDSIAKDAVQALIHLGYTPMLAQKAVQKTLEKEQEVKDLPNLITLAFKNLS